MLRAASWRICSRSICSSLQRRRVVRMVEGQALDAVLARPFAQHPAEIGAVVEAQRNGAGPLDRPADPQALAGRLGQRVGAVAAVEQQAEIGALAAHLPAAPGSTDP